MSVPVGPPGQAGREGDHSHGHAQGGAGPQRPGFGDAAHGSRPPTHVGPPAKAAAGPPRFVVLADPLLPAGWKSDFSEPVAHGWVVKYEGQGGFTKRYLVQRGSTLLYFENSAAPDPRGVFLLDTATVQRGARLADRIGVTALLNRSSIATRFCMVIARPSGVKWELCLPDEPTLDGWIKAFTATGVVSRLPDIPLAPPPPVPVAPMVRPRSSPPPAPFGSQQQQQQQQQQQFAGAGSPDAKSGPMPFGAATGPGAGVPPPGAYSYGRGHTSYASAAGGSSGYGVAPAGYPAPAHSAAAAPAGFGGNPQPTPTPGYAPGAAGSAAYPPPGGRGAGPGTPADDNEGDDASLEAGTEFRGLPSGGGDGE
ncbi:hypothetical protein FNF27_06919 [Cafeteria roenbergensis]|uniref:PH domain-containing protein n=1 Tax=Cafeteria roenbergensis TaxID=33653 RepID=A0A5A8DY67_CAFRO|nr:hypothetical protein FNF27_06919 [Cafeteria roenbergensis]